MCGMKISRVFKRCSRKFYVFDSLLQGSFKDVSRMFQGWFKEVSRVVSRAFKANFKEVIKF